MATLDLWQQTYCLGQMAGALNGMFGTPDFLSDQLADKLNDFYSGQAAQIASWSTVWGPVIFEHDPSWFAQPDNVMYVAANKDRSTYAVCIAGTNFLSQYDVNNEDYAVNTTVRWATAFPSLQPYRTPGGLDPYVSSGTALGVNNLLAMKDGKTGQSLAAYLASLEAGSKAATLIFTGHSLGGALSPTLGLALFNSNGGQLSAQKWANVYLYPTAGPTPGNADLAKYIAQQFPAVGPQSKPYQCWNQNVRNSLDAVPQAWVVSLLTEMAFLYPHSTPWPPTDLAQKIQNFVDLSKAGAATGAGAYTQIPNQSLAGTFNPQIPVTDENSFLKQVGYQHVDAYDILLGVQSIAPGKQSKALHTAVVRTLFRGSSKK